MPLPDLEIKTIDIKNDAFVAQILTLQTLAYSHEAEIIGYTNIPPLFDTKQTIRESDEHFSGLFFGNEIIAFVSTILSDRVLEICRLVVHPQHTRKNYATRLLLHVEGFYPRAERFVVSTAEKNCPALALYKKNGYKQIGKSETGDGLTLVTLKKKVSQRPVA
jgi:ribosomal protein S18 acetylase RimI-like enzyme